MGRGGADRSFNPQDISPKPPEVCHDLDVACRASGKIVEVLGFGLAGSIRSACPGLNPKP